MEGDTKTDLVGKRLQTRLREIYEEEYLRRQTQQNACISCWIFYNWQPVDQSQCNSAFPSAHFKILPAALFFHGIMGREEIYIPQTSLLPLKWGCKRTTCLLFSQGQFLQNQLVSQSCNHSRTTDHQHMWHLFFFKPALRMQCIRTSSSHTYLDSCFYSKLVLFILRPLLPLPFTN